MLLPVVAMAVAVEAFAATPRELLEVIDFSQPVLSPDGKWVVFRTEQASVERNTYDAFLYVQQVDGEDGALPRRIADGGVALRDIAGVSLAMAPVWSPDGQWVYYRALVDGRVDVWRAATDGSGAVALTQDAADVRNFLLSKDGRTLEYSVGATRLEVANAEQAEYDTGIRITPEVPLGQGLFRSGRIDGVPATQRFVQGSLGRGRLLAEVPDRWKTVDLITGMRRERVSPAIALQGERVDVPDGAWKRARSADGWIAMLTRVGEQQDLLLKPDVVLSVRRPDHGTVVCSFALCTGRQITGIQWRPDHGEVLFTVTDPDEGRAQSILRWDVRSNTVHPVIHGRGLVNGGRAQHSLCGVSPVVLVCVTSDTNQPPRLERIDLDTDQRHVLYEPNARLAQDFIGSHRVQLLRWKGPDGQAFTGQFYPAQGVGKGVAVPLFVNYYQCTGFVRGGVGDEWPFASLAEHGIAALCINQADYVRTPTDRYNAAISAVDGAVRLLSASDEVDCTRVGMGGLSFGSEVTLWTAMHSRLLTAASISTPSLSSTYYLFMSYAGSPLAEMLRQNWGLGSLQETPEQWQALAPQFQLEKISAPVLFQMSEQEYLFSLDYATDMLKMGMADMYVFPDEPHQKFQPRHKLAVYERNLDWFRFWLQGIEDPDSSKVEQYARWRDVRSRQDERRNTLPSLACRLTPSN